MKKVVLPIFLGLVILGYVAFQEVNKTVNKVFVMIDQVQVLQEQLININNNLKSLSTSINNIHTEINQTKTVIIDNIKSVTISLDTCISYFDYNNKFNNWKGVLK